MKKFICCFLIAALFIPVFAFAEITKSGQGVSLMYYAQPGLYEIGVDLPEGTYDVRLDSGDEPLTITFSEILDEEGKPDMDYFYSFTLSVFSKKWAGGGHPVIFIPSSFGYLLIEGRSCRLYPVKSGY